MRKIVFSEKEIEDIVFNYLEEQKSLKFIGEKYEVSRDVIKRILIDNNIQLRRTTNIYKADYNIFHTIDNPEKAYWVGFIAADGCVFRREKNGSLLINLNRKDKRHLEKFRDFMKSNVEIKDYIASDGYCTNSPSEMSKICFNSIDLVDDLTAIGVTPKKSLTLKPPKIKEEYYLPYIMGYFDGDGSLYKLNTGEYGINICGTSETLSWICENLHMECHLRKRFKNKDTNNFYITCGGKQKPYNIIKPMFNSTSTHLDRKYDKFLELEHVVLFGNK